MQISAKKSMLSYIITVFLRKKLDKIFFHWMDQPLFCFTGSRVLKFCKKRPIPYDASLKLLMPAKTIISFTLF